MAERTGHAGQQLGNYRLLHLLGQGGFADVYLGEHVYLETQAAIKVLHAQLSSEDVTHFRNEARIIARLIHPNIVRVLEFGVENSVPFLVVDYAPNGTLRQRHPKGVPVPLSTVVRYTSQVADALQYAHDQKVIHRDVKPENMLLGRRNEVLLSDFGIAIVSQATRYQSTQNMQDIAGTVAYMAPEQIQYQAVAASDQYALAVVVYEWLTGERPFQGSFTEIAVKHSLATPPSLRSKVPTLPLGVEEVVMKALAKDPKQRFPTVEAFAVALEQAYRNDPSALTQTSNKDGPASPQRSEGTPVSVEELSPAHQSASTVAFSQVLTPESLPQTPVVSANNGPTTSPETTGLETSSTNSQNLLSTQRGLSRRSIIVGLTGVGVAAALGGTAAVLSHLQQKPDHATGTPTGSPPSAGMGNLLYTYHGHSDKVWGVVWSPTNERIASASSDKTVQVWDKIDGGNLYAYSGHSDSVYAVAWSPDGKHIASASNDTTVQVWDATGGHPFTYSGHNSWVWSVAWSPDNKYIASAGGDKTVQIWNATTGHPLFTYTGHTGPVYTVAWSPDGHSIASAGQDGTVQVWDAVSGMRAFTYQPYATSIWSVAWSPNSKRLASGGNDNTVQVWDASNGAHLFIYNSHTDFVYSVSWSPNGKRIASGSDDKTVHVWNADGGGDAYIYQGHDNSVRGVAWSPDGKWIASGSWDKTVQVWQAV